MTKEQTQGILYKIWKSLPFFWICVFLLPPIAIVQELVYGHLSQRKKAKAVVMMYCVLASLLMFVGIRNAINDAIRTETKAPTVAPSAVIPEQSEQIVSEPEPSVAESKPPLEDNYLVDHNTTDTDFAKSLDNNPDALRYYAGTLGDDALLDVQILDVDYNNEHAILTLNSEYLDNAADSYRDMGFDLCCVKVKVSVLAVENDGVFDLGNDEFSFKTTDGYEYESSECVLNRNDVFGVIDTGDYKIGTLVLCVYSKEDADCLLFNEYEFDISEG